ncbi:thioredoxin domain-containing protein [Brachybacterium sp. FME24]|uniref:DsbA family protein n=1 Tax=Brachybacterium sp. FME24 TaxID=2742605 RepID=UPI001868425B|nr:thioredoxin domain-containing protein [Brachybacterium sp. FME24]
MAASGSSKSAPSKSAQERREAQRDALRTQRRAELRRQRTVRNVVIAAIAVVALVIAGGVGFLIYKSQQPAGPVATPAGVSEDQPYLTFGAPEGSGKPVLEMHLDFMCPVCGQFEEINGEDLQTMVDNEEVTLHLVPRKILDTMSTTGDYSTRSAGAMAAVYGEDPAAALTFMQLMFANQPAERSPGLTDEEIWSYAEEAGASEEVKSAIDGDTYQPWVRQVADPYAADKAQGTPYVEIDGTQFQEWNAPGAMREAVLAAGGESAASDGGGAASDGGEG